MTDLSSTVAVVAGASRGVGKGVALALGEAGATVFVTGRTLKSARRRDVAGSIDETASQVTRLGGRGVAVQCDHTRVEDVRALAETVRQRGGLGVLVNAVGGRNPHTRREAFWEQPLALWDATQRAGVWAALLTTRFMAPLLVERRGLVATVAFSDRGRYTGSVYGDLANVSLARLAFGMAQDFRPYGVTSVAASPGFVRTERVLDAAGATERTWARTPDLAGSESPRYLGRGLAGLASDPARFTQTGQTVLAADLARRYGLVDLDGSRPEPFRIPDSLG